MNGSGDLQSIMSASCNPKNNIIHLFNEQKMIDEIETAKFADVGCISLWDVNWNKTFNAELKALASKTACQSIKKVSRI